MTCFTYALGRTRGLNPRLARRELRRAPWMPNVLRDRFCNSTEQRLAGFRALGRIGDVQGFAGERTGRKTACQYSVATSCPGEQCFRHRVGQSPGAIENTRTRKLVAPPL